MTLRCGRLLMRIFSGLGRKPLVQFQFAHLIDLARRSIYAAYRPVES